MMQKFSGRLTDSSPSVGKSSLLKGSE